MLSLKKMGYEIEGKCKFAVLLKDGTYTDKIFIGKIVDEEFKKIHQNN